MRTLWCLVLAFAGCDTVLEPGGVYAGIATRSGQIGTMSADARADGTLTASTRLFSSSDADGSVVVTRVDETHFDAEIGSACRVRFEHPAWIDVDSGTATVVLDQRCDFHVEGFAGSATLSGEARVHSEPASLSLSLTGDARSGDPDHAGYQWLEWTYSFEGSRPTR
jgi:hypothetical protein